MNEAVVFEIDDLTFEVKCTAYTPGGRGGHDEPPSAAEIELAPLVRMTGPGIEPRAAISYGDFLVRYSKAYDMTEELADNEITEEVIEWVEDSIQENDLDDPEPASYYAEDEDEPWFDNGGD